MKKKLRVRLKRLLSKITNYSSFDLAVTELKYADAAGKFEEKISELERQYVNDLDA